MNKSSLKRNVFYQTSYQILQVITPLITSPYISRMLGAEKIGMYNYCYSTAYLFAIFAFLGLENYGNRSIARVPKDDAIQRSKVFFSIFKMQLISSAIAVLLYLIYIQIYSKTYKVYFCIELFYILSVALDISWFYSGMEEFKTTTLRSGTIKVLTVLLIVTLVKGKGDLGVYTMIMAGGSFCSSLVLWMFLKGKVVRVGVPFSMVKEHFLPNLFLFIPVVSLALFHYMDKVMLGSLSTMAELGYYSNADKIVNIPLGIIQGLGIVMMPRISSLVKRDEWNSINKYINNSIIYCMWIGSAICFGIIGVAKDFVPLFFGEGYDKCVDLLMIFAPVILIKSWGSVYRMQYLIPLGMDKEFNISLIIAAVINIIFNWIAIPFLGSIGAVIGTLLAEIVAAVLYTYYSKHNARIRENIQSTMHFLFLGVIMLICIKGSEIIFGNANMIIRLFSEVIVGAVVYLLLSMVLFRGVYHVQLKELLRGEKEV